MLYIASHIYLTPCAYCNTFTQRSATAFGGIWHGTDLYTKYIRSNYLTYKFKNVKIYINEKHATIFINDKTTLFRFSE